MAPTRSASVRSIVRLFEDERADPDLRWVASLTGATPTEIGRVLRELGGHAEEIRTMRATHLAGGRGFYAQICAPLELYALTRLLRPSAIVELGVSSGVSSSCFLWGLADAGIGRLHSIDLPVRQKGPTLAPNESIVSLPPERSSGWAVPPKRRALWDLRVGPSERLLAPLVDELDAIGLFLHDDLHTPAHLAFELRTIRPKLVPGSVVLADNTQWTGRSFPLFARRLGAEVHRRRGSDLLGLAVPPSAIAERPGRRRAGRAGRIGS